MNFARDLFQYDTEVTSIELRLKKDVDVEETATKISRLLGTDFIVQDRYEQQEDTFRIMKVEKLISYLFLSFILLIACFNVIGSLSMLIIEKKHDIETLKSMGATDRLIRRIFVLEGWMISITGLVAGLVIGICFSLAQQHFGFIKMPGHFIVQAYPIIVSVIDIILTAAGVAIIGYLIAMLSTTALKNRS